MPYSNLNQTTLVPGSLYGESESRNYSMEITPLGGIVIEANLLTGDPFTGTISAAGISTTNPLGFNLLSTTNFNDQALTNIGSEIFFDGMSITDASGNSISSNTSTGDMTINCVTNGLFLSSYDNININPGVGLLVIASDYIQLTANNDFMNLQADDDISLTSISKGIVLTAGDGNAGAPDITFKALLGKIVETTPLVSLADGINDDYINLDMRTAIDQVPTIEFMKDSLIASIYKNNDMFITTDQGLQITSDKRLTITSNFDSIDLNSVNGNVNINSNLNLGGYDLVSAENITATNFYGVFNGNATTASSATNTTNVAIADDNTNTTYYPTFVSNNIGNLPLKVDKSTNPLTYNPSTSTLTATTFVGALNGNATNATNATNVGITDDNTNATFYPVFVSNNTGNLPLKVDKTTNPLSYNPSTGVLTSTIFSGILDTCGFVYLQTITNTITGSGSSVNFSLTSIFNSTYKNYRIVLSPTTQLSFAAYPSYALQAFLGTGTLPTTASLYGFEISSSASTIVSPVYTANATIASTPLIFAVSQSVNHHTIIEIENVGFTATQIQQIGLKCKSFYANPGVTGVSDRNILAANVSGSTITGLVIQQGAISIGNNMIIQAIIYGHR
jgi:hypothetical protein